MANVRDAIRWWLWENCTKDVESFGRLEALLGHFFSVANSLYYALKEEPVEVIGVGHGGGDGPIEPIDKALERVEVELFGRKVGCSRNLVCVVNALSDKAFFRLRGRLALAGDVICVAKAVRKLSDGLDGREFSDLLDRHLPNLRKYQYARDFFTHLDERIGKNINAHGVTGELEVREIGLKFSRDARGCMYFGFDENSTVYFHDKPKYEKANASPKSVCLSKQGMSDLFSLVRDLYDLVTSHSGHAHVYPRSGMVYDLS